MFREFARSLTIAKTQVISQGPAGFLSLFSQWLFSSQRILVYKKELGEEAAPARPIPETDITKGNLHRLRQQREAMEAHAWEFFCDLYDGVQDFFIYENEGRLCHISWIYYHGDPNGFIELRDDEAEIKYCLTFPEYRGKGIYPATLRAIERYLTEQRYRRMFICVLKKNLSSIKGIEKAGFSLTAELNLVKCFGRQWSKKYASIP